MNRKTIIWGSWVLIIVMGVLLGALFPFDGNDDWTIALQVYFTAGVVILKIFLLKRFDKKGSQ